MCNDHIPKIVLILVSFRFRTVRTMTNCLRSQAAFFLPSDRCVDSPANEKRPFAHCVF